MQRGMLDFSQQLSLNEIYEDLLNSVYERQYQKGWASEKPIKKEFFNRILEEIALAVWHENGRTTQVAKIEERCQKSGLIEFLKNFEENISHGVTHLLLAFYFRQSGQLSNSAKTFEFTHKSFGEYLTTQRLIRMLKKISKQIKNKSADPDDGWSIKEALVHWVELCGSTEVDIYLRNFIYRELYLQGKENCEDWQVILCHLVDYVIRHGMPMEELKLETFQKMQRQSESANIMLMTLLSGCGLVTEKLSYINWPSRYSFCEWVNNKVLISYERVFSFFNLDDIYISGDLDLISFKGSNLSSIVFFGMSITSADFSDSNLSNVEFYEVNLLRTKFSKARLRESGFVFSILNQTKFIDSDLVGSCFCNSEVELADFRNADLRDADFSEANLNGSDFRGANLEGANFNGASLKDIKLKRTAGRSKI